MRPCLKVAAVLAIRVIYEGVWNPHQSAEDMGVQTRRRHMAVAGELRYHMPYRTLLNPSPWTVKAGRDLAVRSQFVQHCKAANEQVVALGNKIVPINTGGSAAAVGLGWRSLEVATQQEEFPVFASCRSRDGMKEVGHIRCEICMGGEVIQSQLVTLPIPAENVKVGVPAQNF